MGKSDKRETEIVLGNMFEGDAGFFPLISDGEGMGNLDDVPEELPILTLRNMVLFPGIVMPIAVGREKSLRLIKDVHEKDGYVGVVTQKDVKVENPSKEDLYQVGTVARIIKILEMPDHTTSVILEGKGRFEVGEVTEMEPYLKATVMMRNDVDDIDADDQLGEALMSSIKDLSIKLVNSASNVPPEAVFAIKNIEGSAFLINFISANLGFRLSSKQRLLEQDSIEERAKYLLEILTKEAQVQEIKNDIQAKVKVDIDKQQKEYYLHQQMKTIQDELGGNPVDQEIKNLKERAKDKTWKKEVKEVFEKELSKLERMNPAAAEYSLQSNYVSTMLELPWDIYSQDNFDLKRAVTFLDEDHYGLEKVKDRILEHLAVLKLKGDMKSPILCLYGPPGVGKTSLGKSIARALDRKYVRMSLGGLHDEAEIRGHRKTYIGAMPGRIIQNIKKAGTSNPVFVLDEIDKVSSDFKGDPSAALLEVLDPEQNGAFHDNYLEVEYDLSNVMFVATANTLNTISQPLRDRMEIIDVNGYLLEEKVEIAKRHLIPREMKNHGLKSKDVSLPKKTIEAIIENYSRESGVRQLNKQIATLMRRVAKKIALEEEYTTSISVKELKDYLGISKYTKERYQGNEYAGVVTGLAWTAAGGEILYVESSLSRGKQGKLTLTGNLGDVMRESAVLALEYIKSHAENIGVDQRIFDNYNVHVHVPEGAIPKDGPSAGITMITSLASAFTQRKIRKNLAMTGEITLRGKVLPVGGIKEKILAAKRAGITEIILCDQNKKDLEEIKPEYVEGLKFHFVSDVMEVLEVALLKQQVANAVTFSLPEEKK